jgi:hypothetical protein
MKEAIKHGQWALVHQVSGTPVCVGETLSSGRGDRYTITGGRPPHKPASTGRVWVEGGGEYFPSVFDLEWRESPEPTLERAPDTNAEYVAHGGTQCPFCGSHDITGDEVNIDAGSAWQDVFCNDCAAEWQDTYTLTGYATTNK